jgi:hypothetical protein
MDIESKDVAGALTPTPTFTERTIKGTARIQNNKTLLLASVAQGSESRGKEGLPFLGLIPILGRLFTAPTRDNRQVDIVIAVTPRVIRAPAILPEDEAERDTGSLATPTNSSLEAMIIDEDRQDMLAAARRVPTNVDVQLPDAQAAAPEFVRTDVTAANVNTPPANDATQQIATAKPADTAPADLKPIDNNVKTLQLNQTAETVKPVEVYETKAAAKAITMTDAAASQSMKFGFGTELPDMKVGDKVKVPVVIDGTGKFRSAVVGLKFDSTKVAVRGITFGDVFGASAANTAAMPFLNQDGKMYISLMAKDGTQANQSGTLAFIEIEALAAGRPEIAFDRDVLNVQTVDGKSFLLKLQ